MDKPILEIVEFEEDFISSSPEFVPKYQCDNCNKMFSSRELYRFESNKFCKDCLVECFPTVHELEE